MRPTLLAIAVIFLIASCKKSSSGKPGDVLDCDNAIITDTVLLAGKLTGNWKLTASACSMGPTNYPDVTVKFTLSKNYEVKKDGAVLASGKYSFDGSGTGAYRLQMSDYTYYIEGYIELCGNQAVFVYQLLDGCNNFYEKLP